MEPAYLKTHRKGRLESHNISFVTPVHVVPQILVALARAIEAGLRLPLVYNTSAYYSLNSLQLMEGVVDVYMPDLKYWDEERAFRYLKARDYPQVARAFASSGKPLSSSSVINGPL